MELRKDFHKLEKTLSQKLKEAQESFSEKLEDAKQTFGEKLEDAQQSLSEKLSEVQENASSFQHKVENDLDQLNKANESKTHQILGLRKLQKLLSDKTKISQTTAVTTPSTTKASASAAATPCGPPKSLSQRSTFSARVPDDTEVPYIYDTKLLPGGLVVLSDYNNKCVKLYDWQGRHIQTQALDSNPYFMTVMDRWSRSSWDLWVTLPLINNISLLEVRSNGVNIKTSIQTTKQYDAIAVVTTQTLAVGCAYPAGIDLIDLSGRILRQLSSTLFPWSMLTTPDGFLMMSSYRDDSIAIMKLEDQTIVFDHKVEQIKNPRGIVYTMDGSLIVVDKIMRTLHLIGPDGGWLKKLWTHPGGQDAFDDLLSVSVIEQTCICCTRSGSVFVTDVSY